MPRLLRSKRCSHLHYSGRRCAQLVPFDKSRCGLHKSGDKCNDCVAMLSSFTPPKGWKDTDGRIS